MKKKKTADALNTHILFSLYILFTKSCVLCKNVENMIHINDITGRMRIHAILKCVTLFSLSTDNQSYSYPAAPRNESR
jgi:predicted DCC family thiol-disulfide oxidoreductase YuxK